MHRRAVATSSTTASSSQGRSAAIDHGGDTYPMKDGGASNQQQQQQQQQQQPPHYDKDSTAKGLPNRRRRRRPTSNFSFFNKKGGHSESQKDDLLDLALMGAQIVLVCAIVVGLTTILFLSWHRKEQLAEYPWWSPIAGYSSLQYRTHVGINGHGRFDLAPIPPSNIYSIPHALSHIGDKSDRYATLRKDIDEKMAEETWQSPIIDRWDFQMHPMTSMNTGNSDGLHLELLQPYDIHNCPNMPPPGYPFEWNLLGLLKAWPPDDTTPRSHIHQGLCVFDYQKDFNKAMNYRNAELPFVLKNDPRVLETVQRWNTQGYMEEMLGAVKHRAEYSTSNHFLYWNAPATNRKNKKKPNKNKVPGMKQVPTNWTTPTELIRMTYRDWVEKANITDETLLGPDKPHWYFRLIGCGETGPRGECDAGSSEYLFDEMPYFQPKEGDLYLSEPQEQRGIHCRFGMKGVIAENHFDGSRNSIAVLSGARRYILNHPNQCPKLYLYPKGHPSSRHSQIDWSAPDEIDTDEFPEFAEAQGNEVVLQAGEVLSLPTHWFHYIISLNLNFQCNTRSGIAHDYGDAIHGCGF